MQAQYICSFPIEMIIFKFDQIQTDLQAIIADLVQIVCFYFIANNFSS